LLHESKQVDDILSIAMGIHGLAMLGFAATRSESISASSSVWGGSNDAERTWLRRKHANIPGQSRVKFTNAYEEEIPFLDNPKPCQCTISLWSLSS
jgi:hypothetical protein